MRNRIAHRQLGRRADHRTALLQNLTSALLEHGFVVTTEGKAKELRRHIEPLITRAKNGEDVTTRRELLKSVGDKDDVQRLFAVAKTHADRAGGYVRLTRMPAQRSDGAQQVRVDIVDYSA